MDPSSKKVIYDKLRNMHCCYLVGSKSIQKLCTGDILAELRSEFCCCVIPRRKKKTGRRRRRRNEMSEIRRHLCPCLTVSDSKERKVDYIARLPIEISQLILRKLNPASLLLAACVSKEWLEVCRSDNILREKARIHKKRKKTWMECPWR